MSLMIREIRLILLCSIHLESTRNGVCQRYQKLLCLPEEAEDPQDHTGKMDRSTLACCCYKWQKWNASGNLASLYSESLHLGGSSLPAFPLPPSHGIFLMLNKFVHGSDDAEVYLQAPLEKSSEKFSTFNVFGHHCYLLNAVLIWWIFCLCVAQKTVISRSWSFCCYCKLSQREERREKYLSSDAIIGQSNLKNRGIQSHCFSI